MEVNLNLLCQGVVEYYDCMARGPVFQGKKTYQWVRSPWKTCQRVTQTL